MPKLNNILSIFNKYQKYFLLTILIYLCFNTLINLQHILITQESGVNVEQIQFFYDNYPKIFKVHTFYLLIPTLFLSICLFSNNPSFLLISFALFFLQQIVGGNNLLSIEHFSLKFLQENLGLFIGKTNPQYVKIFSWFVLLFLVSIKISYLKIKKQKLNINFIFLFLISIVIIITTIIFHIAIPSGFFKHIKNQKADDYLSIIADDSYKTAFCNTHNQIFCGYIDEKNNFYDKDKKSITIDSNKFISEKQFLVFMNEKINNEKSNSNFIASYPVGQFGSIGFDYSIVAIKNDDKSNLNPFILDDKAMFTYSRHSEIWFTFLTIIAHYIWTVFGLLLLLWHHRKK